MSILVVSAFAITLVMKNLPSTYLVFAKPVNEAETNLSALVSRAQSPYVPHEHAVPSEGLALA